MKHYLKPRFALPIIALALALTLLMGVFSHMSALSSGREIIIPARGYDPRDVLLGHYVRLQPDLQTPLSEIESEFARNSFAFSGTLYQEKVQGWSVLTPGENGDWQVTHVSKEPPILSPVIGNVALYGDIILRHTRTEDKEEEKALIVSPDLNITRFYANKTEALRIEHAMRDGESDVNLILSVTKDGKARLKGVEVNGQRTEISWW